MQEFFYKRYSLIKDQQLYDINEEYNITESGKWIVKLFLCEPTDLVAFTFNATVEFVSPFGYLTTDMPLIFVRPLPCLPLMSVLWVC